MSCYLAPVDARVAVPFEAPACNYCPGHRGQEYDVARDTPVRAAAAGVATFVGIVVGVRYVVVAHDDGIRATYGMLSDADVILGERVVAGQLVGWSSTRLYFGLKASDDTPLDPSLFVAVATRRPRLVPTDGSTSRPAAQRARSCPAPVPRGRSSR
ncbi:MAG: peptidoglycan DD-metalloendopeptidase family protein [Ilumatobacteraceae bacterium]